MSSFSINNPSTPTFHNTSSLPPSKLTPSKLPKGLPQGDSLVDYAIRIEEEQRLEAIRLKKSRRLSIPASHRRTKAVDDQINLLMREDLPPRQGSESRMGHRKESPSYSTPILGELLSSRSPVALSIDTQLPILIIDQLTGMAEEQPVLEIGQLPGMTDEGFNSPRRESSKKARRFTPLSLSSSSLSSSSNPRTPTRQFQGINNLPVPPSPYGAVQAPTFSPPSPTVVLPSPDSATSLRAFNLDSSSSESSPATPPVRVRQNLWKRDGMGHFQTIQIKDGTGASQSATKIDEAVPPPSHKKRLRASPSFEARERLRKDALKSKESLIQAGSPSAAVTLKPQSPPVKREDALKSKEVSSHPKPITLEPQPIPLERKKSSRSCIIGSIYAIANLVFAGMEIGVMSSNEPSSTKTTVSAIFVVTVLVSTCAALIFCTKKQKKQHFTVRPAPIQPPMLQVVRRSVEPTRVQDSQVAEISRTSSEESPSPRPERCLSDIDLTVIPPPIQPTVTEVVPHSVEPTSIQVSRAARISRPATEASPKGHVRCLSDIMEERSIAYSESQRRVDV